MSRAKLAFAPFVIVVLGAVGWACGSSHKNTGSTSDNLADVQAAKATSGSTFATGYSKRDGDQDADDYNRARPAESDNNRVLETYGDSAGEAVRRAVDAVVKRYYAAAAMGDGATGCSLLAPALAAALGEGSAQAVSQPAGGGTGSCATALSALFKQQHAQLVADEAATMRVADVHLKGNIGMAVLDFVAAPESEIFVAREGGVWKVDATIDSALP